MLSAYTETALNGDFNPKSAIISKSTNTKILTNNIIIEKIKNHLTLLSL